MKKVFSNARWIWLDKSSVCDQYAEFFSSFTVNDEKVVLRISVDGDYTAFINGNVVGFNQYGDYEHFKVYDEIDISEFVKQGENDFALLCWHFGVDTSRYKRGIAGVIFEIASGQKNLLESNSKILCRESKTYRSGYCKCITMQMGNSFLYDATQEDIGKCSKEDFKFAVEIKKECSLYSRPNKKLVIGQQKAGIVIKTAMNYALVDLGEEMVGLPTFSFESDCEQLITVTWGEHIADGFVRRKIGHRDFSFEYKAKKGLNNYTNYMLRLGCRYLEIFSEKPIRLHYLGVIPQTYPIRKKEVEIENIVDRKIYDMCVKSLQLCMMEHYVDTPWREQCLYAFDSRNQMLCGYYAFEKGNLEYVKSNLLLMSKDDYHTGLMSICYPCGIDLTIPSFSLYYTLSLKEYVEYSGDIEIVREVFPRICKYINAHLATRKNGLIYRFAGKNNWNFYDWSDHSDGTLHEDDVIIPDAQTNILTVMALRALKDICIMAKISYPYGRIDEELSENIYQAFYNKDENLFSVTQGGNEYVELVNALAVAFEVISGKEAEDICEKLANGELTSCSLSMKCFVYDALLKTNKEKYRERILADIRKNYSVMVEQGSTATWETVEGHNAFNGAGSLCHGWTATPVYYFHLLGIAKEV